MPDLTEGLTEVVPYRYKAGEVTAREDLFGDQRKRICKGIISAKLLKQEENGYVYRNYGIVDKRRSMIA